MKLVLLSLAFCVKFIAPRPALFKHAALHSWVAHAQVFTLPDSVEGERESPLVA